MNGTFWSPKYDFFLFSIPHKVKILFVKEQQWVPEKKGKKSEG